MDDTNDRIQQALAVARAGRIEEARSELVALIRADENNIAAWAALAQIADTPKDAAYCLKRILQIQPDNEWARMQLQELAQQQAFEQAAPIEEHVQEQVVEPQPSGFPRVPTRLALGAAGALALLCLLASLIVFGGGSELGMFLRATSQPTSQPGLPTGTAPAGASTFSPSLPQPTIDQTMSLTDEATFEPGAPTASTATNVTEPAGNQADQTPTATPTSSPTQALTPTGYPTPTDPPEPPDVPPAEPPPADAPCSCSLNLTCDDFRTQVDAQACFEYCLLEMERYLIQLDDTDETELNDIACEDLP